MDILLQNIKIILLIADEYKATHIWLKNSYNNYSYRITKSAVY